MEKKGNESWENMEKHSPGTYGGFSGKIIEEMENSSRKKC
jgi:hypothetical protein